jgi:sulfate adenylyltransferase subunit 2
VWEYIDRENIPIIPLYFANGNGTRYRSLGCAPCTGSIKSNAKSVKDIIDELRGALAKTPERSGRAQDKESEDAFEKLRRDGYM